MIIESPSRCLNLNIPNNIDMGLKQISSPNILENYRHNYGFISLCIIFQNAQQNYNSLIQIKSPQKLNQNNLSILTSPNWNFKSQNVLNFTSTYYLQWKSIKIKGHFKSKLRLSKTSYPNSSQLLFHNWRIKQLP